MVGAPPVSEVKAARGSSIRWERCPSELQPPSERCPQRAFPTTSRFIRTATLPSHGTRHTQREALPDQPPPASVVGPAPGFLPRVQSLLWLQFHSCSKAKRQAFGARFTSLVLSPVELRSLGVPWTCTVPVPTPRARGLHVPRVALLLRRPPSSSMHLVSRPHCRTG